MQTIRRGIGLLLGMYFVVCSNVGCESGMNENDTLEKSSSALTVTTLLGDDFEDGNANGWTVHNTSWAMATDGTKVFQGTNTSGYARASAGSTTWTDQTVKARFKAVSWSGSDRFIVLGARFVDINNYYYIALRSSGKIELKRLKGNSPTTLATKSITVTAGTWYTIKLEAVGSNLKAYVNDVLQLSAVDTTFPMGKIVVGIYYGKVNVDDVVVTAGAAPVLPGQASSPTPAEGATGVSLTPTLGWTAGSNTTSHDIYFGTSAQSLIPMGNQTSTTFTPPLLGANTTYFWRVDEKNAAGTQEGIVWQFTTTANALTLLSDNFEDGNSTGWTVHNTAWVVATDGNKVFQGTNTSGYARASAGSTTWTDQAVEARFKAVSWSGSDRFIVLGARFVDINNYYYIALRSSGKIELKRLKGNSSTTLATKTITVTAGTWYTIKLEVLGSSLKAYVNHVLQLSAVDTNFPAGKIVVGIYYGKVNVDDVLVTTGKPPVVPGEATSPTPSAGATDVSVTPALAWTAGSDATSHDIYLGTTPTPPFIQNQAVTSFLPGILSPTTTYYWHVDEKNATGTTPGPLWSFTTGVSTPIFRDATALTWSQRLATSEMARRGNTPGWNYETGLFAWSLFELDRHVTTPTFRTYATSVISRLISSSGVISGYSSSAYTLDNIMAGRSVLELHQRTGESRYQTAANTLRAQLNAQPRTSDGGFWHKKVYPYQMWLDGLYMAEPFLARYGLLYSQPATFNEVTQQFRLMDTHAYNANDKLWYHGWDEKRVQVWANPVTGTSPSYWGRSIGWYAMGLVDTLDYLPENHPGRAEILDALHRFAEGIVGYQDAATGTWYQVVDQGARPANYLEASASSMFTYVLAKAINHGYLSRAYTSAAIRAYTGLVDQFVTGASGSYSLNRICKVAGLSSDRNGSFEYYISEPIVSNDLKGVGPFILAGVEIETLLGTP